MHSTTVVATIFALAAVARAQPGRFFCSTIVNGVVVVDPTLCDNPTPTGDDSGDTSQKSNGFTPVNSACVLDAGTGSSFCGYTGAVCNPANTGVNTNCDNGNCVAGVCVGGFGVPCAGTDGNCLGFLYCTDANSNPTAADTCGGIGAYCQDPYLADQSAWDLTCASTYCGVNTAQCTARIPTGGYCGDDPLGCVAGDSCSAPAPGTACDIAAGNCLCTPIAPPSSRARARRNTLSKRASLCPASHTACAVAGAGRGFECIDTMSNLEQCGACSADGGVDCTALAGVDAVGCVSGQCEIWACADGYSFDSESNSCKVALVV